MKIPAFIGIAAPLAAAPTVPGSRNHHSARVKSRRRRKGTLTVLLISVQVRAPLLRGVVALHAGVFHATSKSRLDLITAAREAGTGLREGLPGRRPDERHGVRETVAGHVTGAALEPEVSV